MSISRHPRDSRRGAAAVEFALLLPILMALGMGAIDWGYFFFVDQLIANAAREGARAGSLQTPPPAGSVAAAQSAAQSAVTDYLQKMKLTGAATVTTAYATVSGTDAISVQVNYPTGSLTGFFAAVVPKQVIGAATMRW